MPDLWNREILPMGLEARLRAKAPQPDAELVVGIAARLRAAGSHARRSRAARLGLAATLTLSIAAELAAVGGVGYAADATRDTVRVVTRAIAAAPARRPIVVRAISSGSDQYRPGFGFGDPDHNHEGPPGVERADAARPDRPLVARASREGLARLVSTRVTFSEQAGLWISVVDPRGTPLLLTQRSRRGGSRVGNPVRGPQTKFIQYALLVPRTVTITLRIPANLLRPRVTYRIRILAIDPQGNRTTLFVPFRV